MPTATSLDAPYPGAWNQLLEPLPQPGFGYCGAPLMELENLALLTHPGSAIFLGLDQELARRFGTPNPSAASQIQANTRCMLPWTQACGVPCADIGQLSPSKADLATLKVFSLCEHLCVQHRIPLLVACDHTASLPAVLGCASGTSEPLTYLYFDAHFDLGQHHSEPGIHNGNFVDQVRSSEWISEVVNVGGRGWSTFLPIYREVPKFRSVPGGFPPRTVSELLCELEPLRGRRVYVSLDADVLDPSAMAGVCCPEPGGFSLAELFQLCQWVGRSCHVVGADVCEVRSDTTNLGSEQALMRCLFALLDRG